MCKRIHLSFVNDKVFSKIVSRCIWTWWSFSCNVSTMRFEKLLKRRKQCSFLLLIIFRSLHKIQSKLKVTFLKYSKVYILKYTNLHKWSVNIVYCMLYIVITIHLHKNWPRRIKSLVIWDIQSYKDLWLWITQHLLRSRIISEWNCHGVRQVADHVYSKSYRSETSTRYDRKAVVDESYQYYH